MSQPRVTEVAQTHEEICAVSPNTECQNPHAHTAALKAERAEVMRFMDHKKKGAVPSVKDKHKAVTVGKGRIS